MRVEIDLPWEEPVERGDDRCLGCGISLDDAPIAMEVAVSEVGWWGWVCSDACLAYHAIRWALTDVAPSDPAFQWLIDGEPLQEGDGSGGELTERAIDVLVEDFAERLDEEGDG